MTEYSATTTGNATENAWGPIVQVALEQRFPPEQRITQDPLAYPFLPAYLRLIVKVGGTSPLRELLLGLIDRQVPGVRGGVLCRKRAIDDRLLVALKQGMDDVVNLGAGMDTRACRMPPGYVIPIYEVDLPNTIMAKAATLRRVLGGLPVHLHLVTADLERQDIGPALQVAGYTPGRKVFFIMEGVSQYVTEAAVRQALEVTRSAGPGSRLAFTYIRRGFLEGRELYDLEVLYRQTRMRKSIWRFGLNPEDVAGFLDDYGWREVEHLGSAEYQTRYVRPTGRNMPVMAIEQFVYAERV